MPTDDATGSGGEWLSVREAAARMGLGYDAVLGMLQDGRLRGIGYPSGRRTTWRIRRADIDEYMARHTNVPPQE